MKKLFFILTILIFAQSNNSVAQTRCEDIETKPKMIFSTSYGKLTYNTSQNIDQLTRLGGKHGIVEKGLFAAGLATLNVVWEVSVTTMVHRLGSNKICVLPATVEVFIGYEDPVIYLARELVPNTCEYNVVLRHEQTHQQINKTALEYFIPELKHHLTNLTKTIKPRTIRRQTETDQATSMLTQEYIENIHPLVEAFKRELMKEQGKLDNHTNYQLEGDLCKYYHQKQNRQQRQR